MQECLSIIRSYSKASNNIPSDDEVEAACHSEISLSAHDYEHTQWKLSDYVLLVLEYISGFVVRRVKEKICCDFCSRCLEGPHKPGNLIALKTNGGLIQPSEDVLKITRKTEEVLRQYNKNIFQKGFAAFAENKVFKSVASQCFESNEMFTHDLQHEILSSHKFKLIKLIIQMYLKVRLHYEGKVRSQPKNYIRHSFTKQILFQHQ